LYLRNIVEQEVADGRLEMLEGHWRWIGDPIVAPGLVELIESPHRGTCQRRSPM